MSTTGAAYGIPLPIDASGGPAVRDLAHGEWRQSATCRSREFEWWFAKPTSARSHDAVRLCEACPVRRECLAASLLYGEEFGLWGGLSHLQRRPLLARLAAGASLGSVIDQVLGNACRDRRVGAA